MHFPNLDAYFHVAAHGNKEAYQKLYEEFKKRAERTIKLTLNQISNFTGNPVDFSDLIDTLFFKIINEYDHDRGCFEHYMEYTFSHRLTTKVQNTLIGYANQIAAFENNSKENKTIENLPDPTQRTLSEEIAIKNFKTRISTPNRNKTLYDRTVERIMALHYLGYTSKEICAKLKISSSKYRNYIRMMKDDNSVINFKLEMK